jgi:hypothetical protein
MSIRNNIPERVFENPNADMFVSVLDGMQDYKKEVIYDSLRAFNPVLCTDKTWLIKTLAEYGVTDFPIDMPLAVLQQFLLNINTILSLRGSKLGVELYCSVLSLGEVTVDDSDFYAIVNFLILNSKVQGTIIADSNDAKFYLVSDSEQLNGVPQLGISIQSPYFSTGNLDGATILNYITATLPNFLAFSPGKSINITTAIRSDYFFHNLLNQFFV